MVSEKTVQICFFSLHINLKCYFSHKDRQRHIPKFDPYLIFRYKNPEDLPLSLQVPTNRDFYIDIKHVRFKGDSNTPTWGGAHLLQSCHLLIASFQLLTQVSVLIWEDLNHLLGSGNNGKRVCWHWLIRSKRLLSPGHSWIGFCWLLLVMVVVMLLLLLLTQAWLGETVMITLVSLIRKEMLLRLR